MRKGLILLGVPLMLILGILVFGTLRNACSFAPDGSLNLSLIADVFLHSADERTCDPWRVIESDPEVVSIEIGGSAGGWSFQQIRPVTISRDGRIAIYEPVGPEFDDVELIAEGRAEELASDWVARLSVYSGYNRLSEPETSPTLDEDEPFNIQHYMDEPIMKCWGEAYDAGGLSLIITFADGSESWTYLDESCASPAMSRASQTLYQARDEVYHALDYQGDHLTSDLVVD